LIGITLTFGDKAVVEEAETRVKLAAGGVVLRRSGTEGLEVLLVHRPRYNDWSLPKGKLDRGESLELTAIREVKEETGLTCRIIRPLSIARYNYRTPKGERPKAVQYYLMLPEDGVLRTDQDDEIDSVCWVPADQALDKLNYDFDRQLVDRVLKDEQAAPSI